MIGEKIGQFEVVALIGQGGMGTVYKARQPTFDRYVAIKLLPRQLSEDPLFLKRFQREAKLIAQLEHPAILPVYDYGEHDGMPYIVMRLIETGTLRKKMYYERLELPVINKIVSQVAAGLDHAHANHIIHRDLKPSNILIDDKNNAYLADFGIAKMLGTTSQLTGSGVVGTPSYMSPEQCQGMPVRHTSDIYALGTILYEMVSGKAPFDADTPMAVMYMHVKDPPPSLHKLNPALPPAIDRVIERAMAKNPEQRYQTSTDLAEDFERAVSGRPLVHDEPPEHTEAVHMPEETAPAWRQPESYVETLPGTPPPGVLPEYDSAPAVPPVRPTGRFPLLRNLPTGVLLVVGGALGLAVLMGIIGIVFLILAWNAERRAPTPTPDATLPGGIVELTSIAGGATRQPTDVIPPTEDDSPTDAAPPTEVGPPPTEGAVVGPTERPPTELPVVPPTEAPTELPPPTAPPPTEPPPTPVPIGPGRIAYTEGESGSAEVVIIEASGGGRNRLTNNSYYDGEPDWSPDGSLIAFESAPTGDIDIYVMNDDGSGVRRLTTATGADRHPDWSPDGALIAYEFGAGSAIELYVMSADGSGRERLTNNTYGDRAPKFSPDGTLLTYMTESRGKWEIAIMDIDSREMVEIFDCPAPDCRFPAWSPDGTQIVFNTLDSAGGVDDVWVLDVATGDAEPLTSGDHNGRPVWSGDGRYIYFNSTEATALDLYRLDLNTGAFERITSRTGDEYAPDWGVG